MKKIIYAKSELVQINKVYQSTKSFEKFLIKNKVLNKYTKSVLDAGCGFGSQIQYFSKQYPKIKFTGWDYLKKKINRAKKLNKNANNKFYVQDLLNIKRKDSFDLAFSIHTFCCFKNIDEVLKSFTKVNSKWIAINSLFYDGPLDVLIHIRDRTNKGIKDDNPDGDFNIHSLEQTKKAFLKGGYKLTKMEKFFPSKAIIKPHKKRGSYTVKTEFSNHTVFSGPVHLPWYFLLAKKIKR